MGQREAAKGSLGGAATAHEEPTAALAAGQGPWQRDKVPAGAALQGWQLPPLLGALGQAALPGRRAAASAQQKNCCFGDLEIIYLSSLS